MGMGLKNIPREHSTLRAAHLPLHTGILMGIFALIGVTNLVQKVRQTHTRARFEEYIVCRTIPIHCYVRHLYTATTGNYWSVEVLNPFTHCLSQGTPFAIKLATVVGMGLLIALIGMVSIKIVVSNPQVWMASPVDPYT